MNVRQHKYCEKCRMNIDNAETSSCHYCGQLIVNPFFSNSDVRQLTTQYKPRGLTANLLTVRTFVLMVGARHPNLLRSENRSEFIKKVKALQPNFKERTIDREARQIKKLIEKYYPKYFQDDLKPIMEKQHTEFYAGDAT